MNGDETALGAPTADATITICATRQKASRAACMFVPMLGADVHATACDTTDAL